MSNPYAPPSGRPHGETPGDDRPGTTPPEGGHPPPGSGPGRGARAPAPAPPKPEDVAALRRRMGHFALLLLATWVVMTLPLPWQAAALLFAVATLVVGIRAFVLALRARVRGLAIPLIASGIGLTLLVVLSLATMLVLWPVQMAHQECLREALTVQARNACEQQFDRAVSERLDGARSRLGG